LGPAMLDGLTTKC